MNGWCLFYNYSCRVDILLTFTKPVITVKIPPPTTATAVVVIAPLYPSKPADRIKSPAAVAPPIPIAMSIVGP